MPSASTARSWTTAWKAFCNDAIVGSDLCYYEDDVDALAATIVAHLQPGARAHLLSPLGRTGLPRLVSTLAERGEVTDVKILKTG